MDEAKIAHLTMVQEVIGRMASNSLALKSLAATVAAAIVALAASQSGSAAAAPSANGGGAGVVALMSLVPLVMFWFLDGYYLRIERAYRGLFDAVRKGDGSVEPFSMNHRPFRAGFLATLRLGVSPVMLVYPALMGLIVVISKIVG